MNMREGLKVVGIMCAIAMIIVLFLWWAM